MTDPAPQQTIDAHTRNKRAEHSGGRPRGSFFLLKQGRTKLTTTVANPIISRIDELAQKLDLPRNRVIELAILGADWDQISKTMWDAAIVDIAIHNQSLTQI